MSAIRAVTPSIYEALKAEGFKLPDECRDVKLLMPTDGVMVLQYEVFVRDEELAKLGRALVRLADTT